MRLTVIVNIQFIQFEYLLFFFFFFYLFCVGRHGYELIGKQWQILNHQSLQSDLSKSPDAQHDKDEIEKDTSSTYALPSDEQPTDVLNTTVYKLYGYRYNTFRFVLFHIVSIGLCGLPYLLINWFPAFVNLKYCKSELKTCDFVIGKLCTT